MPGMRHRGNCIDLGSPIGAISNASGLFAILFCRWYRIYATYGVVRKQAPQRFDFSSTFERTWNYAKLNDFCSRFQQVKSACLSMYVSRTCVTCKIFTIKSECEDTWCISYKPGTWYTHTTAYMGYKFESFLFPYFVTHLGIGIDRLYLVDSGRKYIKWECWHEYQE